MFKTTGANSRSGLKGTSTLLASWGKILRNCLKIERSLKRFIKSHRSLYVSLTPAVRVMRKISPPKHERLSKAFAELFQPVEGGSLIVKMATFHGSFEIGCHSDILRRILICGDYEPEVVEIVKNYVDPNRDAIDVGANIGLFTILLSNLISSSNRVLAIEPTPGALKYLRRNIEINNLAAKILLFEGVAAEHLGKAQINVINGMEEYSSLGNMVHPSIKRRDYQQLSVPSDTIDSLTERFALSPGFIKIDTEGAEYEVLSGCEQTMLNHRPVILCESWSDALITAAGGTPGAVADLLRSSGYLTSECMEGELLAVPEEYRIVSAETRAINLNSPAR
jgi:FkbM family methyltransferase